MSDEIEPKWLNRNGVKRLQPEFQALLNAITAGKLPQISDLNLPNDKYSEWRFNISNFDTDVQAGRDLNNDLYRLQSEHGQRPVIEMAMTFPDTYPTDPPFLRVILPRMKMYTGHVTAGGSICIEALAHSGGQHCWKPTYTVENIILLVINNMLHCEQVFVSTYTGPGGMAGPLRVDFNSGFLTTWEYSEQEANDAFERMARNHGWTNRKSARRPAALPPPRQPPPLNYISPDAVKAAVLQYGYSAATLGAHIKPNQQTRKLLPITATHFAQLQASPNVTINPTVKPTAVVRKKKKRDQRQVEVIDLTMDDDEDDDDEVPFNDKAAAGGFNRKNQQQRQQQPPAVVKRQRNEVNDVEASFEVTVDINDVTMDDSVSSVLIQSPSVQQQQDSDNDGVVELVQRSPKPPTLEQRLHTANQKTRLRLVHPPEHWDVDEGLLHGECRYVALPLPHNVNAAATAGGVNDSVREPYVDQDALAELVHGNGIEENRARKVLLECRNDVDAALLALTGSGGSKPPRNGGNNDTIVEINEEDVACIMGVFPNKINRCKARLALKKSGGDVSAAIDLFLKDPWNLVNAEDQLQTMKAEEMRLRRKKEHMMATKRAMMLEEAEKVLQRFEEYRGIRRHRVVRIERVQNLKLYSKFTDERVDIETDIGDAIVQKLWHGAGREVLATITKEGFDTREARDHGAYGCGAYFADSSSYSGNFSQARDASAINAFGGAHVASSSTVVHPVIAAATTRALHVAGIHGIGLVNMRPVNNNPGVFIAHGIRGGGGGRQVTGHGVGGFNAVAADNSYVAEKNNKARRRRNDFPLGEGLLGEPQFPDNTLAMLLCDVALGVEASRPAYGQKKPPEGKHSVGGSGSGIHCVYKNFQAYPAYIVHYTSS